MAERRERIVPQERILPQPGPERREKILPQPGFGQEYGRTSLQPPRGQPPAGTREEGHGGGRGGGHGHGHEPYTVTVVLVRDWPEDWLDRVSLYFGIYGALFLLVGALAVLLPTLVAGVPVGPMIAWLLVVGGAVSILHFFLVCGAPGTTAFFFLGLLHLATGLWLVMQPQLGLTALALVTAAWFFIHGLLKLGLTFNVRAVSTWWSILFSGLSSIVLGITTLVIFPSSAPKTLAILFGSDLMYTGFAFAAIAFPVHLAKSHRDDGEPLLGRESHV